MLNSKAPKTKPSCAREISSKKLLHLFLRKTDCFLNLRNEYINESDSVSKP